MVFQALCPFISSRLFSFVFLLLSLYNGALLGHSARSLPSATQIIGVAVSSFPGFVRVLLLLSLHNRKQGEFLLPESLHQYNYRVSKCTLVFLCVWGVFFLRVQCQGKLGHETGLRGREGKVKVG